MDRVAFSRLIAFLMQRENHLLMRIVLRKPLLRVGQTCIGGHLASVAAALLGQKRENLMKHDYVFDSGSRRFVVMENLSGSIHFRKPVVAPFDVPATTHNRIFSVDVFTDILCVALARHSFLFDNSHFTSPPTK